MSATLATIVTMHLNCSLVKEVCRACEESMLMRECAPVDVYYRIPNGIGFKNRYPENSSQIDLALTSAAPCERVIRAISVGIRL